MENSEKKIENITLEEFVVLVNKMRFNQRRYRSSSKEVIKQTLEPLETEVDEIIAKILNRQTKLF